MLERAKFDFVRVHFRPYAGAVDSELLINLLPD